MASCSRDTTILLWVNSDFGGKTEGIKDLQVSKPVSCMTGHTNAVSCVRLQEQGSLLFSSSYDRTVKLWDTGSSMFEIKIELFMCFCR